MSAGLLGRGNRRLWYWIFVGPFLAGLLIFIYIPICWSIYLSFFDARNTVTPTKFVGLDNYAYLLHDEQFRSSLVTFTVFAIFIVPATFAGSLGLALLVNQAKIAKAFFRSVFFIPTATSYVIASMIWRMSLFNGARFGLLNSISRSFGGDTINWLGGGNHLYWVVLVSLRLWLQLGFYMILFIAGLQRIPVNTYEAAALDGARGFRMFAYITFPQLRATSAAVLLLILIAAFQAFDEFYNTLSSVGGTYPPYAQPPLVYLYLVSLGSGNQDLGVGSAGTMIIAVLVAVIGLGQLWLTGRDQDRPNSRRARRRHARSVPRNKEAAR